MYCYIVVIGLYIAYIALAAAFCLSVWEYHRCSSNLEKARVWPKKEIV